MAAGDDVAVVLFVFTGNLAEEGDGGGVEDVVVVFHLGVEGAAQEEEGNGECQSDKQAQEGGAGFVGRHGDTVDACGVEHFAVGFDGGLANHEFFASAQQVKVEVFFDFLLLLEVLKEELLLRHHADFRRGR